jgi:hypothetical protein
VACLAAGPRRTCAGLPCWQWLVSCLPLAVLAWRSVRHVPLCATWSAPVLALLVGAACTARARSWTWQRLGVVAAGLAAVPVLLTCAFVLAHPAPAIFTTGPVLGAHSPRGAAAFLRANGLTGRMYNPLWWGSYLTWELYPNVLVSMDGRNVTLFARQDVEENLTFYLVEGADPATPLRQAPDFLLVPADAPVLPRLRVDAHWAVLYEDSDAILFAPAAHSEPLRRRDQGRLVQPAAMMSDVFQ